MRKGGAHMRKGCAHCTHEERQCTNEERRCTHEERWYRYKNEERQCTHEERLCTNEERQCTHKEKRWASGLVWIKCWMESLHKNSWNPLGKFPQILSKSQQEISMEFLWQLIQRMKIKILENSRTIWILWTPTFTYTLVCTSLWLFPYLTLVAVLAGQLVTSPGRTAGFSPAYAYYNCQNCLGVGALSVSKFE